MIFMDCLRNCRFHKKVGNKRKEAFGKWACFKEENL
jgi:hypothetical protein